MGDGRTLKVFGKLAMAGVVAYVLITLFPHDPNRIRTHLEQLGYTDVRMEGRYRGGCGRGFSEFPFHAVAPAGNRVTGRVCNNLFFYEIEEVTDRS